MFGVSLPHDADRAVVGVFVGVFVGVVGLVQRVENGRVKNLNDSIVRGRVLRLQGAGNGHSVCGFKQGSVGGNHNPVVDHENDACPAALYGADRCEVVAGEKSGAFSLLRRTLSVSPNGLRARLERTGRAWEMQRGYESALVPMQALEEFYVRALQLLEPEDRRLGSCGNSTLNEPSRKQSSYLEFGVCHGSSMLCMERALKKWGRGRLHLIGFDSFQGLPSDAATDPSGHWRPGQFVSDCETTTQRLLSNGVSVGDFTLVDGWFDETLNQQQQERRGQQRCVIAMIDCDLYRSASEALRFCAPLLAASAVSVFDDWYEDADPSQERTFGESRAFAEFLAEFPEFSAEEIQAYGATSKAFLVRRN
ncbi:MAG: hypothetical protein ACI8TX_000398 [Hyphomicrobiaceae bacterium]|jgi:hypothetical protein